MRTQPGERGELLVHASFVFVALTMCILVVDFGMIWVARVQAQAMVDAAAHAGAVAQLDPLAMESDVIAAMDAIADTNSVPGVTLTRTFETGECPQGAPDPVCAIARVEGPVPGYFIGFVTAPVARVGAMAAASVYESPNPDDPAAPLRRVRLVR